MNKEKIQELHNEALLCNAIQEVHDWIDYIGMI